MAMLSLAEFGDNLSLLIEYAAPSHRRAALDMGIPPSTLSRWCNGEFYPKYEQLFTLKEYLDVPWSVIMEGLT